jgi:hypothetical protein
VSCTRKKHQSRGIVPGKSEEVRFLHTRLLVPSLCLPGALCLPFPHPFVAFFVPPLRVLSLFLTLNLNLNLNLSPIPLAICYRIRYLRRTCDLKGGLRMIRAKKKHRLLWAGGVVLFLSLLGLIPDAEPDPGPLPPRQSFAWKQDEQWKALEGRFVAFRSAGCEALKSRIDSGMVRVAGLIEGLTVGKHQPNEPLLSDIEGALFSQAPLVAVCPNRAGDYLAVMVRMRTLLKEQSLHWDMNDLATRQRMYRLLYGGRAAAEEVLLQAPKDYIPSLVSCFDEPSQTPAADVMGMRVHSGDILVSRGGAPTSAMIARGSDYQGNFSHVAIVHIDPVSRTPQVVESHIEKGVAIASFEQYLQDAKLRIMVLRLRSDLPAMVADPTLPHKAATRVLDVARERHIPYDFAMDVQDGSELFCSEVVSSAYAGLGVRLWMGMSTISSPGVARWLAGFGVRHFETQEPSDLEYDPQLRVVAEWRDPDALLKEHIDNAILESLLEGAEAGDQMVVRWYMLPLARAVKLYSSVLNLFGNIGPIPEGMSATSSLRHLWLVDRHELMKGVMDRDVETFSLENGYTPPYWELLNMARRAKAM